LDSDDLFHKEKLENTYKFIVQQPQVKALHHAVREFDDQTGKAICDVVFTDLSGPHEKLPKLLDRNNICTSSVTLNRELLIQINKFDTSLNGIEDYYCWLSVSKRSPWYYSTDILTLYRVRAESLMGFRPIQHYLKQNINLLKVVKADPLFSEEEYKRLEAYLMKEVMVYYVNNSVTKFGIRKTFGGLLALAREGHTGSALNNAIRITKNQLLKKIFK
jgi:hypothetical protein